MRVLRDSPDKKGGDKDKGKKPNPSQKPSEVKEQGQNDPVDPFKRQGLDRTPKTPDEQEVDSNPERGSSPIFDQTKQAKRVKYLLKNLLEHKPIFPLLDGYTTDDITYVWKDNDPVQIPEGLSLPRFSIEKYSSSYCNVKTNTGDTQGLRSSHG